MKDVHILAKADFTDAANKTLSAVGSTLGPYGSTTIISQQLPIVTKDGVTVVKALQSSNNVENTIMKIIGEAAIGSSEEVGDGTTTATVLACKMLLMYANEWPLTYIEKRDILEEMNNVIKKIKNKSVKAKVKDLYNIALVSSNGDKDVAEISVKAARLAGKDGLVMLKHGTKQNTEYDVSSGFRFHSGVTDKEYIKDRNHKNSYIKLPYVIVGTKPIEDMNEILSIINAHLDQPIVIFCTSMSSTVSLNIRQNVAAQRVDITVIDIPGAGETVDGFAEDIAKYCNVPCVSYKDSIEYYEAYADVKTSNASYILTSYYHTTIEPKEKEHITEYVKSLKAMKDAEENEKTKREIQHRISSILGKIVTIKVGSATFIGKNEIMDRVDDTVHAVQSAIVNGVSIGGGLSMYNITDMPILKDVLNYPASKISSELNILDYDYLEYLVDNKIIDPTESITSAIRSGISSALNILSAKTMLVETDDK